MELLDFTIYASAPIVSFSQSVMAFYKNQQNLITKIVTIIKLLFILASLAYLCNLYFYKKQTKLESSILLLILVNVFTIIIESSTIYFLFVPRVDSVPVVDSNISTTEKIVSATENVIKPIEKSIVTTEKSIIPTSIT